MTQTFNFNTFENLIEDYPAIENYRVAILAHSGILITGKPGAVISSHVVEPIMKWAFSNQLSVTVTVANDQPQIVIY